MNFSLEQNVDILSAYHVERFTHLRDNAQYQDADAIAQEYICNGEVEDDNYQYFTDLFEITFEVPLEELEEAN